MRRCMLALALAAGLAPAAAAADLPVRATDRGFVNACAEMDNVLVALESPGVARFTIRARHPVYALAAADPDHDPDFTGCVFPEEPIWDFTPESHILFEDHRFRLLGHRLAKSWRPELVDVTVGGRTWPGIHLLQLLVRRPEKDVEILVLYPHDGYWRAKPLPLPGRLDGPYGASFLLGPVETDRRPLVRLSGVRFDPATVAFTATFRSGGALTLRLLAVGADELRMEATLSAPVTAGPFALLSSMHVTEDNADTGRLRVRDAGGLFWRRHPPVGFMPVTGAEFDFGRDIPSRHNTLAPDILFGPFTGPLPAE